MPTAPDTSNTCLSLPRTICRRVKRPVVNKRSAHASRPSGLRCGAANYLAFSGPFVSEAGWVGAGITICRTFGKAVSRAIRTARRSTFWKIGFQDREFFSNAYIKPPPRGCAMWGGENQLPDAPGAFVGRVRTFPRPGWLRRAVARSNAARRHSTRRAAMPFRPSASRVANRACGFQMRLCAATLIACYRPIWSVIE